MIAIHKLMRRIPIGNCLAIFQIISTDMSTSSRWAKAGRRGPILYTGFASPDHPQLPQLAESGYLKSLFFRLP